MKTYDGHQIRGRFMCRRIDLVEAVQVESQGDHIGDEYFFEAVLQWVQSKSRDYSITYSADSDQWVLYFGDKAKFTLHPGDWLLWAHPAGTFFKSTREIIDRHWVEASQPLDPETKVSLASRVDRLESTLSHFDVQKFKAMERRVEELAKLAKKNKKGEET